MDTEKLRQLLQEVKEGHIEIQQALEKLQVLPYENLEFAKLDLHREIRIGLPEVVFCQSKTVEQVCTIFEHLSIYHDRILGTRATPEMASAVYSKIPEVTYNTLSRLLILNKSPVEHIDETFFILIACAGTADLPVAEEAAQTVEFLGNQVKRAYDVGIAGIHRLFDNMKLLRDASVIISIAGMEGALTSVIGGLVTCPVIGVPTSVGYGASFGGLAALLSMLNSCAPGVAVVNIDNGFGAGLLAHKIIQVYKKR